MVSLTGEGRDSGKTPKFIVIRGRNHCSMVSLSPEIIRKSICHLILIGKLVFSMNNPGRTDRSLQLWSMEAELTFRLLQDHQTRHP